MLFNVRGKKKEKKIVNENIIYTAGLLTLVYVIIIIILLLFDKWLHPTKIIQRTLLRSVWRTCAVNTTDGGNWVKLTRLLRIYYALHIRRLIRFDMRKRESYGGYNIKLGISVGRGDLLLLYSAKFRSNSYNCSADIFEPETIRPFGAWEVAAYTYTHTHTWRVSPAGSRCSAYAV